MSRIQEYFLTLILGITNLVFSKGQFYYSLHPLSFYFRIYLLSFLVSLFSAFFLVYHYILQIFINLSDNFCYLKKKFILNCFPWPVLFIYPGRVSFMLLVFFRCLVIHDFVLIFMNERLYVILSS